MTHSCATQIPFNLCPKALNYVMYNKYHIGEFYPYFNFGTVEMDWEADPVQIYLRVRGENGTIALEQRMLLSDLQPSGQHQGEDCSWEYSVPEWRHYPFRVWQTSAAVVAAGGVVAGMALLTALTKMYLAKQKPKTS